MIEQLLLGGQVLVVLLVYVFVWRVMRTARRDLRTMPSDDSTIIPAADAAEARRAAGLAPSRLIVQQSPCLRVGQPFTVDAPLRLGRGAQNDIVLDDPVVSTVHAEVRPPDVLADHESTNGTSVNGAPVNGSVRLRTGDVVQIGSTSFRFERSA